ncbi:MAG: hypothetical protein ACK5TQ_21390 [Acetobacteraceae bacterium]
MQHETQAPIGINRKTKPEFRWLAILRLRQQRGIRKACRDLPRRAREVRIGALNFAISAYGAQHFNTIEISKPRLGHLC